MEVQRHIVQDSRNWPAGVIVACLLVQLSCADTAGPDDVPVDVDDIWFISYDDLSVTSGVGDTCAALLHVVSGDLPFQEVLWYGSNYSSSVRLPTSCETVSGAPKESSGIDYIIAFTPSKGGRYAFSVGGYIPGGPVAISISTGCNRSMSPCLAMAAPPSVTASLDGNTTYFLSIENLPAEAGGQAFEFAVEASTQ